MKDRTKQDYGTPRSFISAAQKRFGRIAWDLCATESNKVCESYFSPEQDSLQQDWSVLDGVLWLNPPYSDIRPWASKASTSIRQNNTILMLVPAMVGSQWFRFYVLKYAQIYILSPRISFVGTNGTDQRDYMLAVYRFGESEKFVQQWRWNGKEERIRKCKS